MTPTLPTPPFPKNFRVLFQGDSITDGNRGRDADPNHILGHGYAFIVAAKLGGAFPEYGYEFFNRGISGDTVAGLTKRWDADTLDLRPDLLSLLIGVNDASARVPLADYEAGYDSLLCRTLDARPQTRLLLCEPFTLPGQEHAGDWETWRADIEARGEIVRRLAAKYGAGVAAFQAAFDEAALRAPAEHWIWDTVHPTYSGHQVMAEAWMEAVEGMGIQVK